MLTGLPKVPICVGYEIDGERVDDMPMTQTDFHHAKPDLRGARRLVGGHHQGPHRVDDLPENARRYIARIEELCGTRVSVVGVGPGREENVVLHPLLP